MRQVKVELYHDNFQNYNRHAYGFEVDKKFYSLAKEKMLSTIQLSFTLGQLNM